MLERVGILLPMSKLSVEQRVRVLSALVDGNSIRATSRITGAAKGTILKLLVEIGTACASFHDERVRNLTCKRIQVDEIWSFCYGKERNISPERQGQVGFGDVWTWTALDADTKLMPCFFVGDRSGKSARVFLRDLESRLANRVQLTSDGHRSYLIAVEDVFGWGGVDYAMLDKIYSADMEHERRYSPPVCVAAVKRPIMGRPDSDHISTSYVERSNLTMRMSMRRFARLTNAFSKKLENHKHAVALYSTHYNWCRPHMTLTKANGGVHKTPAMAAGLTDHVWTLVELVALLPEESQAAA